MQDLVETELYWANSKSGTSKDKFMAFIDGYKGKSTDITADWAVVLDKGLGSKLGWLEYSFKRSLGIESCDEAERKMGTEHVIGSIDILHNYMNLKDKIVMWLKELMV